MQRVSAGLIALCLFVSACSLTSVRVEEPPAGLDKPTALPPKNGFSLNWPVDKARLTRGFLGGRRPHHGLDLAAPRGTNIYAAHDGLVIYTGKAFRGYGKMVIVEYNSEWATLYAHLDSINIEEGDWVKQGDILGKMGATGRTTGVHLHFEIRRNRKAVDPLLLLP